MQNKQNAQPFKIKPLSTPKIKPNLLIRSQMTL